MSVHCVDGVQCVVCVDGFQCVVSVHCVDGGRYMYSVLCRC